jgi:rhodanese-related sulfurtransferase
MLLSKEQLLSQAKENVTVLDVDQALSQCQQCTGVMIDVREPAEAQALPIKGAVNIPRGVLEMQMLERYPDENLPIFVHCASGARAMLAAEQLQRVGYKNVYVIGCDAQTLAKKVG